MGNIIPINRQEARLQQELAAAEARLRGLDCGGDYILQWTVDLLADCLWRLPFFAAGTKYETECLRSLNYIASRFEMTQHNLSALLLCIDFKDDQYQNTFGGAA